MIPSTSRRRFLQAGALAAVGGVTGLAGKAWPAPAIAKKRPPNFLFVISDQLGLDAISAHGCTDARTPNLDRLIGRGVTFLESHSSSPVCSPARSSLFTGRMPVETGVINNSRAIHPSRPNMGQWLQEAGYDTVYSGKWHLPSDDLIPGFRIMPVGGPGAVGDAHCSRACEAYLHQHQRKRPFLLVASFLQPHDICYWSIQGKYLVPPQLPFAELARCLPALPPNHQSRPAAPKLLDQARFERFSDEQWRYYIYLYYRQVEMVDAEFGRLLDALDETGQTEETVVIFTADHGEGRGRHMHVQKWYPYDEAAKVPLVVACPGRLANGLVDRTHLVSGIDVMDTVCDLAGVRPPKTVGRSLRPLLENRSVPWRECLGSEHQVVGRMLRTARFKYVHYPDDPVEQLFDMQADPWEMANLYQEAKYADVLVDHRRMLSQWQSRLEPVTPSPDMSPKGRKRGRAGA